MFETDYLEIVGLPSDGSGSRPDLDNAPVGINGLVFKAADAESTYTHLQSIGMEGPAPINASRPVKLDGQTKTASFRNVNVRPGRFEGGRVYFCEHQTPELVWRPEYQRHQNGVTQIDQFIIVALEPTAVVGDYAKLLDIEVVASDSDLRAKMTGMDILVQSPTSYRARYGDLASPLNNRSTIFGAIRFRTKNLSLVRSCLERIKPAPSCAIEDHRIVICLREFDTLFEFVS